MSILAELEAQNRAAAKSASGIISALDEHIENIESRRAELRQAGDAVLDAFDEALAKLAVWGQS